MIFDELHVIIHEYSFDSIDSGIFSEIRRIFLVIELGNCGYVEKKYILYRFVYYAEHYIRCALRDAIPHEISPHSSLIK